MPRLWATLCLAAAIIWPAAHLAAAEAEYDYLLVLPLQHNYYQPGGPDWLTMREASGASAVLAGPAGLARLPGRWQAELCGGWMSGGRSGLTVATEPSGAWPSLAAAKFSWRDLHFGLGWRRVMDVSISFPDVLNPLALDRAQLMVDQAALGASWSGIDRLALGVALSLNSFSFDWHGPAGRLAEGAGSSPSLAASLEADLGQGFGLAAGFATKADLSVLTEMPDSSLSGTLKLAGTVPPRTRVALSYRPEPGFEVSASLELTGWHLSSSGYYEQADYHLGCRMALIPERLEASFGSYSLKHPLDSFLRRYDEHLQDLYFLSAGLGLRLGPAELKLAGASSRPLSGAGLNQSLLAAGISFGR